MSRKPWLVFFPWGPCTLSAYTRAEGSSVGLGMAPEPGKVCQVPTWHSSLSPTWGRLAPQLLDLGLCLVLATADQGLTRLLSRGPRAQANLLAGLVRVCVLSGFSHVWFFETLWTVTPQAPLSMGFSRQEYGSRLPFPFPRDLPNPGIKLNVSNSYHFTCCDSVDQQFGLRSAGCFLVWSHLRSLMFYGHPSAQMKLVSLSLIHMSGEWCWLSAGPCVTSRPRGIFM